MRENKQEVTKGVSLFKSSREDTFSEGEVGVRESKQEVTKGCLPCIK